MIVPLFLATAEAAAPILRRDELAARWSEPSALTEFRISGLAGHLARAVFNVERYLDTPAPDGASQLDAVRYFLAGRDPDDDTDTVDGARQRHIRDRGEQAAAAGPVDLADRYDAARARLTSRLPGLRDDLPVLVFDRWVLRLDQCLITRLVELVVHLDDLAVSLELETPAVPDEAADVVIATLARISRHRYGAVPVLRALARRERAPRVIAAF